MFIMDYIPGRSGNDGWGVSIVRPVPVLSSIEKVYLPDFLWPSRPIQSHFTVYVPDARFPLRYTFITVFYFRKIFFPETFTLSSSNTSIFENRGSADPAMVRTTSSGNSSSTASGAGSYFRIDTCADATEAKNRTVKTTIVLFIAYFPRSHCVSLPQNRKRTILETGEA
jgi:hypothetical protein